MTMIRNVTLCRDADDLAQKAAAIFQTEAEKAIAARGRFLVALAGGSTPERAYSVLAQPERAGQIAWERVYCFFSDERLVPPDDERSNYGMARKALLSRVPLPAANVFPVETGRPDADEAAVAYAETLAAFFGTPANAAPPRFDLILLGLGDDGHTASLFPDNPVLTVQDEWVVGSPPGVLPPPVDRITFTFPLLNAARHVAFLVSGEKKAAIVRDVLENSMSQNERPAVGVLPKDGLLTWLLDAGAASLLADQ